MKFTSKAICFALIFVLFCLSLAAKDAYAANIGSIGVAIYLQVNGKPIEDGSIIITSPKGYFISTVAYDPRAAGVISLSPAVVLKLRGQRGYPVITSGTVNVKVTGTNGNIKRNDPIAVSSIPGTGMKAEENNNSIGSAVEAVSFSEPTEVKIVPIMLNLQAQNTSSSTGNSLLSIFNVGRIATYEKPLKVIQYVVAGFIVIISFASGFLIFARAVNTGIEALGRNPLAGRMIQLSIAFNIFLIVIIVLAGVSIAYVILRL